MTFYYTARAPFGKDYDEDNMSWEGYVEWSKLTQLQEVVSVDCMLNKTLVEPDRNNPVDWDYIVTDNLFETGFFNSLEYVLRKMEPRQIFNLLTVVIEPLKDCKNIELENFEFVGYDLLDEEYGNSALTNCGGFDEIFLPSDLSQFGLMESFEKAYDIKRRLLENNPDERHAKTNVIAIWRHKNIGRRKSNR